MSIVTSIVVALASAACCDPIYSISDLTQSIQYVDSQTGYFVGIEKNTYTIGTAINNKKPGNDMSQISAQVENCSSKAFRCRALADLVFAIPRGGETSAEYLEGPRIILSRLADGGWHGSATCSMLTKTGCSPHVDMKKPVVAYQYDINPKGVLTSLSIQTWNNAGKLVNTQNLVLVSKSGLKLN
ncbi:hypothetical protein GCM10027021_10600 [Dyella kyungheensis]